jgi:hypothetical protein
MNRGEILIRITIWITLIGYLVGAAYSVSRGRWKFQSVAKTAWTVGCLALLFHVALAFHYYHGWNHDSAYRETARQTAEVFGVDWGGGLFINYAMLGAWVIDVIWWWMWPVAFHRRPQLLTTMWQGFLLFIFFNATVVFGSGATRWIGLAICAGLSSLWLYGQPGKARLKPESISPTS